MSDIVPQLSQLLDLPYMLPLSPLGEDGLEFASTAPIIISMTDNNNYAFMYAWIYKNINSQRRVLKKQNKSNATMIVIW